MKSAKAEVGKMLQEKKGHIHFQGGCLFGSILLTVITVMHVYTFQRAATVPFLKRHVSRKLIIGTGMVLWAVFFLGHLIGHGNTGEVHFNILLLCCFFEKHRIMKTTNHKC
jgi:hypothetical protein